MTWLQLLLPRTSWFGSVVEPVAGSEFQTTLMSTAPAEVVSGAFWPPGVVVVSEVAPGRMPEALSVTVKAIVVERPCWAVPSAGETPVKDGPLPSTVIVRSRLPAEMVMVSPSKA